MKITTTLSAKTDKHTQKNEILLRLIVGKVNGKAVAFRAKSRIFVSPERWDAKEGTIQTDIRTTKIMSAQKRKEVEEEKQATTSLLSLARLSLNFSLHQSSKLQKSGSKM